MEKATLHGFVAQRGDGSLVIENFVPSTGDVNSHLPLSIAATWASYNPDWKDTLKVRVGSNTNETHKSPYLCGTVTLPKVEVPCVKMTGYLLMPVIYPIQNSPSTFQNITEVIKTKTGTFCVFKTQYSDMLKCFLSIRKSLVRIMLIYLIIPLAYTWTTLLIIKLSKKYK